MIVTFRTHTVRSMSTMACYHPFCHCGLSHNVRHRSHLVPLRSAPCTSQHTHTLCTRRTRWQREAPACHCSAAAWGRMNTHKPPASRTKWIQVLHPVSTIRVAPYACAAPRLLARPLFLCHSHDKCSKTGAGSLRNINRGPWPRTPSQSVYTRSGAHNPAGAS